MFKMINNVVNLYDYYANNSYVSKAHEPKEWHVILITNTIIQPVTVVIKSLNALVTIPAVFCVFINVQFTDSTLEF